MSDLGVAATTNSIAGQMVAVRSAGALYYTYTDYLGSVVGMTNAAGGIIANSLARYDPFGNYRTWPGSNVNPLISDRGFTGHVHDNTGPYPTQNVGLIYMNARYYLPEVGRFISADTIVPEPKNPQSYNRYAYAANSPINFTDPTGHMHDAGDNFGSGSPDVVAAYSLAPGHAYTVYAVPFTPTLPSDPRGAELRPYVCTTSSGCQSASPLAYLASPTATPGVPRSSVRLEIGQNLDLLAAAMDFRATALSLGFVGVQAVTLAAGGPGLDDAVVSAAYYGIDQQENSISWLGTSAVLVGDLFSGESNVRLSPFEIIVGQDSLVLTSAAIAGQGAGLVPVLGPSLDTIINLALNGYDASRLVGQTPTFAEVRFDRSGFYLVLYPR